jgi:Amt family ammonium transporter
LVACLFLGRRREEGFDAMMPHNLPMTMLGAALLWFGWFGFNAGSALGANGLAGHAFLVTNTCAAVGALSWVGAEWLHHGKPTALGFASGLVAGLVAITPAAGFVSPASSILMGIIVGPLCYYAVSHLKSKFGYDDTLDAFGIMVWVEYSALWQQECWPLLRLTRPELMDCFLAIPTSYWCS